MYNVSTVFKQGVNECESMREKEKNVRRKLELRKQQLTIDIG